MSLVTAFRKNVNQRFGGHFTPVNGSSLVFDVASRRWRDVPPDEESLFAFAAGVNVNVAADTQLSAAYACANTQYMITRVVVVQRTGAAAATATYRLSTLAAGGGQIAVATAALASLTAVNAFATATLAAAASASATAYLVSGNLFFGVVGTQGAAATVDVYVYAIPLDALVPPQTGPAT